VHVSRFQLGLEPICSLLGFAERAGCSDTHELSVVAELEASEGEDLVALLTALGVLALLVMTVAVASELTSASSEQKRRAESAGPAARR
jgi:hypothetical protein